jgi:threonine dehydrogenase-like Zn-dependent dehydrogenase
MMLSASERGRHKSAPLSGVRITQHLPLEEAPHAYKMFRDKQDQCIKVVLKP